MKLDELTGRIIGLLPSYGRLPARYWRWTWAGIALRLVVALPFLAVAVPPYLLAKGLVWVLDQAGGWLGNLQVRAYNHDLRASGWKPPARRVPALKLSPEWQQKLDESRARKAEEHSGS